MKALIVFKSGAQVEVDVDELSTNRDRFTHELVQMEWKTSAGYTAKLHTVTLSEIAAIVIRCEDASQPEQVGTDGS